VSEQTGLTDDGPVAIEVPRDREGTFEPPLIGKQERAARDLHGAEGLRAMRPGTSSLESGTRTRNA
jgi:hypothetical protein